MCDCITQINELLRDTNTRLRIPLRYNFKTGIKSMDRPLIETEKYDSRKREAKIPLFPTYCPFCGEKYPEGGA